MKKSDAMGKAELEPRLSCLSQMVFKIYHYFHYFYPLPILYNNCKDKKNLFLNIDRYSLKITELEQSTEPYRKKRKMDTMISHSLFTSVSN